MNKYIISAVGIVIATLFFFILGAIFNDSSKIFDYNLMEILTSVVVSTGVILYGRVADNIKNKNKQIELIIENIHGKFLEVFGSNQKIQSIRKTEYTMAFKYISNKLEFLKKISQHLKCDEAIKQIELKKDTMQQYIDENISQEDKYFEREEVKDKIPNLIIDIENQLDNVVAKMYL